MSDLKLYRVKATGEIVVRGPDFHWYDNRTDRHNAERDLTPVVAAEPNRVLPEGLEVVDVSDRVRRDGGPMPVVIEMSQPLEAGETMVAIDGPCRR